MIIKSKDKLVPILYTLYDLWEKEYPGDWPSGSDGIDSNFYNFITKKGKMLLGTKDTLEEITYWYSVLSGNENLLNNSTLTEENVFVPELNSLEVTLRLLEWQKYNSFRKMEIDCYLNPQQMEESFWFFNHEDFYNIYDANEVDRDWIDGELMDETVHDVRKVTKPQQESINNFLDTLSESELNYLTETIIKKNLNK